MIYRLAIPKWYFNNNQNRSLENILHTHSHTHTPSNGFRVDILMGIEFGFGWNLLFAKRIHFMRLSIFIALSRVTLCMLIRTLRVCCVRSHSSCLCWQHFHSDFGFMCCVHSFNCSKCLSHSKQKGKPSHRVA